MRIAIIAPAWFAVPPTRYGGIEWVVSILADGLVDHGHEVTLFAAGDSQTKARLVTSYDDPPSMRIGLSMPDLHHALTCFANADQFDLINDHSGPLAAALGGASAAPVCHTVHGPLTGEPGDVYSLIDQVSPSVGLISISDHQRTPLPNINWLATCHNAIAMDAYPFHEDNDGYLLFLGRMSPDKGAHNAVRVAAEMGLPMILAGKMHDVAEREHFQANVEPFLSDDIRYVGEVSHDEKVRLLQRARGDGVPDPVAGAVRPGDGGVDGLWHAGGGDPVRGRAGGDRAGAQRRDRGRVCGTGGRGGAGAVAGSGRVPGKRGGAVLAAADDRGL